MSQGTLSFQGEGVLRAISPLRELGAYEALWSQSGATFKSIADKFRTHINALPSDLVDEQLAKETGMRVVARLREHGVGKFGVRVYGDPEYPCRLREADHPVELLYFQGAWDFVQAPSVAVVGTRHPSKEGILRTRTLVRRLIEDDWTVVSGLATGVDTVAHKTALECGGRTIAVIGTPLSETYPSENKVLQSDIAAKFLLISQVPFERYAQQIWKQNRLFFPARNVTMAALTKATVIVEASDTSGTLIQARAALKQGRKLFILESCFQNPSIKWPHDFEKRGAIRVANYEQIRDFLAAAEN